MNKKGRLAIEILIMMVVVVLTSAVILLLVKSGTITVKNVSTDSVLNTEFFPVGRGGSLAIRNFKFCGLINEEYECLNQKSSFIPGEEVHFSFVIESGTFNGDVVLIENYRLKSPKGEVILDVDQKNDFNFDAKSNEKQELITFKDFFLIDAKAPAGEYILELIIENPLISKRATLTKKFMEVELS